MTTTPVQPLTDDARPTGMCPDDCPNKANGHCGDHQKMESSRIMGMAVVGIIRWFVPVSIVVLIGVFGFFSTRIDSVEGKVSEHITGSNDKLDQIHHSVMTMEFNMRHDFEERGQDFQELKYMEEY